MNKDKLSLIIPAYNEESNIRQTLIPIITVLNRDAIPYEILVVNDNSLDATPAVVEALQKEYTGIRLVNRSEPRGFGRAIRSGIEVYTGDIVAIVMADSSDDPEDIVRYYNTILKGYDCVFGSRFMRGSKTSNYPFVKLMVNRIINRMLQILFVTRFNDLTNAFKMYRSSVIQSILPLRASHFNITIELSLSALIRRYRIAQIPIKWYGRTWGCSNLRLSDMGRRYLAILIKIWSERIFILDDLLEEDSQRNKKTD
jgi:dolichol-phosphate mannosyltransferase